jgi:hypothetical protein
MNADANWILEERSGADRLGPANMSGFDVTTLCTADTIGLQDVAEGNDTF